jgi:SHS2 domain-containing protein
MRAGTSRSPSDVPLPGVTFLDHTADVGIAVDAPSPELLFHRSALGMLALLRGDDDRAPGDDDPAPHNGPRPVHPDGPTTLVDLTAPGIADLLADWLRELLFLHEVHHRDYVDAAFEQLPADAAEPADGRVTLRARVRTATAAPAVREIKGVTYHELEVEGTERGWRSRVIFDV